jgi:hypothetical protein
MARPMPDKATLKLEYRVADGEVRRRAEVFGWPNALRTERQYWIRLYDSRADGPTAIDVYGRNGAFIARTRFLRPAAERFFAFAPALAANLTRSLSRDADSANYARLSDFITVAFETEMFFEGDIHIGTHFGTIWPRFEVLVGAEQRRLLYFDRPDHSRPSHSLYLDQALARVASELETRFGAAIADLLTGLPVFP